LLSNLDVEEKVHKATKNVAEMKCMRSRWKEISTV